MHLRKDVSAWPDWVWQAQPDELAAELNGRRRPDEAQEVDAWSTYLTQQQQSYIVEYTASWVNLHGTDPADSTRCVFDLSVTPHFHGVRGDHALPTMRRRQASWWSPSRSRWMLPREKAACMGFSVYGDLARAARVPLDSDTIEHVAGNAAPIGNAMHVANVGVVMLAAMFAAEWH
jgi:hypothetical protein